MLHDIATARAPCRILRVFVSIAEPHTAILPKNESNGHTRTARTFAVCLLGTTLVSKKESISDSASVSSLPFRKREANSPNRSGEVAERSKAALC